MKLLGIESYGLIGFFATLQATFQVLDFGLSQTITREMEGHTGPLFAHFVVPINLALLFAVAAIIALAATGR